MVLVVGYLSSGSGIAMVLVVGSIDTAEDVAVPLPVLNTEINVMCNPPLSIPLTSCKN